MDIWILHNSSFFALKLVLATEIVILSEPLICGYCLVVYPTKELLLRYATRSEYINLTHVFLIYFLVLGKIYGLFNKSLHRKIKKIFQIQNKL